MGCTAFPGGGQVVAQGYAADERYSLIGRGCLGSMNERGGDLIKGSGAYPVL